jgi:hypothetical protein
MAITTQKSDQVTNQDATPPTMNALHLSSGSLRIEYFKHTQSGAGDDGSSVTLVRLPAGQGVVFKQLSLIRWTAFGASRVMDIGYAAYTERDGDAVSAGADIFEDGRDVSSANAKGVLLGTGTNADDLPVYIYDSKAPVDVKALVTGGTWPDAAVVEGWIAYTCNKG